MDLDADGSMRTRVVFGSACHPRFVSKTFSNLIEIMSSFDSVVLQERPSVVYEVPSHQVNFMENMSTNSKYHVHCNDSLLQYCDITTPVSSKTFKTDRSTQSQCREFDRVTIYKEKIRTEFFILMQNANYSNVTLYKKRKVFYMLAWGVSWRMEIREVYLNPQSTEADPYSVWFCGNPKYEIVLTSYSDLPENDENETLIFRFLSVILPRSFNLHFLRN